MTTIHVRRVYEPPTDHDGLLVLVDRLWPRGVRKADLGEDVWDKDVAPSPELRTWWSHDPERFAQFAERYRAELAAGDALERLAAMCRTHSDVTLLYAARDPEVNHAVVLREALEAAIA